MEALVAVAVDVAGVLLSVLLVEVDSVLREVAVMPLVVDSVEAEVVDSVEVPVVVKVKTLGVLLSVEPDVVDSVLTDVAVVPLVVDNVVPEMVMEVFDLRLLIKD